MEPVRRAVSRETRLLLAIILISLSMLWVLARIRFPERPPTPNPMPPVLAQLAPRSALDDIASSLTQLQPLLEAALVTFDVRSSEGNDARPSGRAVALRFRNDLGVGLIEQPNGLAPPTPAGMEVVARDRASHLVVVRLPAGSPATLSTWTPRRLEAPRFLIAADASDESVALRPVFVGALSSTMSPMWPQPLWAIPGRTDLVPGTFVFSIDGALAGLVVERGDGPAIVPADAVIATANRLVEEGSRRAGRLGLDVQALSPAVASGLGASAGAVVTWVDPRGPAATSLAVADVIERIDGQPVTTLEDWTARVGRLAEGESIVLTVRRRGDARDVELTAGAEPEPMDRRPLGLTLRRIQRVGVEVVRVEPDSAAARAGLRVGDLITMIGDIENPTPAQISRLFATAPATPPLVVAVTRGETHHLLALDKTW